MSDLTDLVDTLHAMNAAKTEAQQKRNSAVSPEDAVANWAINLEAAKLESFLLYQWTDFVKTHPVVEGVSWKKRKERFMIENYYSLTRRFIFRTIPGGVVVGAPFL